ncbi:protein S100-A12-like [Sceloporus undulatus]|uniref:protein S100-A12-like n=1 Tax=Sceloporus undulatus TaxID=8520 RepID=UPI001C4B499D|nr:protein S100-A12-like [Sceloporus undulatus]
MSQMEIAIEAIINIFHQYSVRKPHPDKLSKGETKQLIEKELAGFLKNQVNPAGIEALFKELDQDQDKELSFEEFMQLITKVSIDTHTNLHKE